MAATVFAAMAEGERRGQAGQDRDVQ